MDIAQADQISVLDVRLINDQSNYFLACCFTCMYMHWFLQVQVVASYDRVFPSVDEGAKDVDDNCEAGHVTFIVSHEVIT